MELHDVNVGDKFNHWTIIDANPQIIYRRSGSIQGYLCECDCYNKTQKIVDKYGLFSGHSTSCGCTRRKTHGLSHTKFYQQYYGMIKRCELKTHKEYKYYGERGIKVCEEWRCNFQNFYQWAINNGYEDGLTIDRIDVNGDYCPENCRWIPLKDQMSNKRNNIVLEYDGKSMTIKQWSKQNNVSVSYETLLRRYHDGWAIKDILFKEAQR